MTSLSLFVLSHDADLLDAVPTLPDIRPVDLRDLGLPTDLTANELCEARFFLSDRALDVTTEYVGVFSARHDEKYANRGILTLEQIACGTVTPHLEAGRVFAPLLRPGGEWLDQADVVHPGMTALLREAANELPGVEFSRRTVFASTFITSRDVYLDFIAEFRRLFEIFHARYGLDFPFGYRCSNCGTVAPDGFGRYRRDRHSGYFYERVAALYFARPQFELVGLREKDYMSRRRFAREVWRGARAEVTRYRRDRVR